MRDCDAIKQKVLNRIQSWTSRVLSYAGRVQLAISVLHGVQAYWASIVIIPKLVLKETDDTIRNFVWSGPDLKSTGAKVAWNDVCVPKKGKVLEVLSCGIKQP